MRAFGEICREKFGACALKIFSFLGEAAHARLQFGGFDNRMGEVAQKMASPDRLDAAGVFANVLDAGDFAEMLRIDKRNLAADAEHLRDVQIDVPIECRDE